MLDPLSEVSDYNDCFTVRTAAKLETISVIIAVKLQIITMQCRASSMSQKRLNYIHLVTVHKLHATVTKPSYFLVKMDHKNQ